MEKTICIDGKEVRMRASALIPRLYRFRFGRDIIRDINELQKSYKKLLELPKDATNEERQDAQLSVMDLTIFENVAYIMAKHGDDSIPNTLEEWLDGFQMFSIYEVMPHILELWNLSNATTAKSKKK